MEGIICKAPLSEVSAVCEESEWRQCKSNANETEEICREQALLMVVVIILVLMVSEAIGVLKGRTGVKGKVWQHDPICS